MISKKIADKLQGQEYRSAFVASQINVGIPFQIKALMKARGWTQEQLAERTGMLQPRISAVLKPGKVRPNIETLRRFAEAFDCGLLVRFAPYSELARWSEDFNPERFNVPSFKEDTGFIEKRPQANATEPHRAEGQTPLEEIQRDSNNNVIPIRRGAAEDQTREQPLVEQPEPMLAGCGR
ncbi:MAG: helix-turn-helix domain-containing protein [Bryobacteraceae bacterium]